MICFLALIGCYDYFVFSFYDSQWKLPYEKNKKGAEENCFCLFVLNRWSYGIVMWEVFTIGMWIFVKKNPKAT